MFGLTFFWRQGDFHGGNVRAARCPGILLGASLSESPYKITGF